MFDSKLADYLHAATSQGATYLRVIIQSWLPEHIHDDIK